MSVLRCPRIVGFHLSAEDKAKVLEAKARLLLDAIVDVVTKDVADYSERFKGDPTRKVDFNAKPSGGFSLYKSHYPAASLECTLEYGNTQIKALYAFRNGEMSEAITRPVLLALEVDVNDNVFVRASDRNLTTTADVSRYLIEKVLFA